MGRVHQIVIDTDAELETYLDHLGWTENPFARPTTLDEYVLPSPEDIADIASQLRNYMGPVLIHSRFSGAGKTTLLQTLLEEFDDDYRTAYVGEHNVTPYELVAIVADKLGINKSSSTKLTEQKIEDTELDEPILLGIDEFGLNDPDTLHVIQFLNDLDGFHVLLTGMSSQWESIGSLGSDGRAFQRRVAYQLELEPFEREQTTELLQRRIASATSHIHEAIEDVSVHPFNWKAIDMIYERAKGIPAVIVAGCSELVGLAAYRYNQGLGDEVPADLAEQIDYANSEIEMNSE